MAALRAEVVHRPQQVARKIGELERPAARDRECESRSRSDEDGFQGYSTLAPEIFTARPLLSLSVRRNAANSSGELPTTS